MSGSELVGSIIGEGLRVDVLCNEGEVEGGKG